MNGYAFDIAHLLAGSLVLINGSDLWWYPNGAPEPHDEILPNPVDRVG